MPRSSSATPRTVVSEARARYFIRESALAKGWNTQHPSRGGDFLEENEIVAQFPNIGLGQKKPDFLVAVGGEPALVIEAKNETGKSDVALAEAIEYAEMINSAGSHTVSLALGASGTEESGYLFEVQALVDGVWVPLTSDGFELTAFPSRAEVENALAAGDGTTSVEVPSQKEFIDSAIEVSHVLRQAKVEAPVRPKVIGALILTMYESALGGAEGKSEAATAVSPSNSHRLDISTVNTLVKTAIEAAPALPERHKTDLTEALFLSQASYEQLGGQLGRLIAILRRLNLRAVMHSGVDFLGLFYEAFLRYGYDNNSLGIVFTPRHITRLCTELVDVTYEDKVIDLACGTGGFLVSAFDRMLLSAPSPAAREEVKKSLHGYDTNPTIWALALLNMYFRGDGKSNIIRASSLEASSRTAVAGTCTKGFLNPPFSQRDEPEWQFIDATMAALRSGGRAAVVVKSGIFADNDNKAWRARFTRDHTVEAVISLPDDLFYPTAAPTSILIAKAHIPQPRDERVYLARISNDGFEKLKGKRIERSGSEIPAILEEFRNLKTAPVQPTSRSITVLGEQLRAGAEWAPHEWLPTTPLSKTESEAYSSNVIGSLLRTVASYPELKDCVLQDFLSPWKDLGALPYGSGPKRLDELFEVANGRSDGEKNYSEGALPYVSSGDQTNSIVSLVSGDEAEIFSEGGITLTAFGQASVQPWPFLARGNGGSSVRVLLPKYAMTLNELIWFAGQINSQRWRFFYARMAIKSRIVRLKLDTPKAKIEDNRAAADVVTEYVDSFQRYSSDLATVV